MDNCSLSESVSKESKFYTNAFFSTVDRVDGVPWSRREMGAHCK